MSTPIQNPKSSIQKSLQSSDLRPLNQPDPLAVEADARGVPKAVLYKGVFRPVASITDTWRIDDEWWRDAISRRYYRVRLDDGSIRTFYEDRTCQQWFAQTY